MSGILIRKLQPRANQTPASDETSTADSCALRARQIYYERWHHPSDIILKTEELLAEEPEDAMVQDYRNLAAERVSLRRSCLKALRDAASSPEDSDTISAASDIIARCQSASPDESCPQELAPLFHEAFLSATREGSPLCGALATVCVEHGSLEPEPLLGAALYAASRLCPAAAKHYIRRGLRNYPEDSRFTSLMTKYEDASLLCREILNRNGRQTGTRSERAKPLYEFLTS